MNKELSCSANMGVFLLFLFWQTPFGKRATGLSIPREERHSGGSRAIKEAPDSGIRQQKTDFNWDLRQQAVRRGGHVDRTPACLRQPLRTSRSGWVVECECLSVFGSVWTCKFRHANTLLAFCDWNGFKAYQIIIRLPSDCNKNVWLYILPHFWHLSSSSR